MSDATLDTPDETAPPARRGRLLMIALPLLAAVAGFAPTYKGLWSPAALIAASGPAPAPRPAFVPVPEITVSVPGVQPRRVLVGLSLEVDEARQREVERLMPRVVDTATAFLGGIAPEAYDRRGVLEVIRAELNTRIALALGDGMIREVLMTEFALK